MITLSTLSSSTHTLYSDGGGWTLFATKVSYTFLFITSTFNAASFNTLTADMAGCIPSFATAYTQVLFRFKNTAMLPAYVVYNRNFGTAGFDTFLQGQSFCFEVLRF